MVRIITPENFGMHYDINSTILLNGKPVKHCVKARLGSNGYVDCYANPIRVNKQRDAIVMTPRLRGNVQVLEP